MLHTPGATYLIIAYAVIWIGFFAYLGWIALRLRGLRTELETVRELVDERERGGNSRNSKEPADAREL
jgi:CcmD family protein